MNKLFFALLSASITSAIICNETTTVETDKESTCAKAPADTKVVVAEAVVETTAKKNKCANCPCTSESKAAEVTAETEKAADCPCEEAGKACPCPSMQTEQQ